MIEDLAGLLAQTVELMRALRERAGYQAHPESPLVKAATEKDEDSGVYEAVALIGYEIAAAQIAAAEDHIDSMAHLLQHRKGQVAPLVLARAAIEAASRAAYIIDPTVTVKDRASAVVGERIHELRQTRQLILGSDPNGESPKAQADLVQTEQAIEGLKGFAMENSIAKPGRLRFTSVVTRTLSRGTSNLSLATTAVAGYSALAHASPDMLLTHTVDRTNPEWAPFEIGLAEPNTGLFFDSIVAISIAYSSAVNHQVRAYGWPSRQWADWLDHLRNALSQQLGTDENDFDRRALKEQRLWRIGDHEPASPSLPRFIQDMRDELREEFIARFGRAPTREDPFFFDPNADQPTPWVSEDEYVEMLVAIVDGLGQLTPAREFAIRDCRFLASTYSWGFIGDNKQRDWKAALYDFYSAQGEVPHADHDLVELPDPE